MKFLYFVLAISIAQVSGSPVYDWNDPDYIDPLEYEYGSYGDDSFNGIISARRRPELEYEAATPEPDFKVNYENSWSSEEVGEDNLIYTLVAPKIESGSTDDQIDLEATIAADAPPLDREHCPCGKSKTGCEDGWVTFGNKCLRLKYTRETYKRAFDICRDEHNARILWIQSAEEQTFLEKYFIEAGIGNPKESLSKYVHLGLERQSGFRTGFHWVGPNETKIPITYQNWDIGQPEGMMVGIEDCAAFSLTNRPYVRYGKWHDYDCDAKHVFVCEKEALQ